MSGILNLVVGIACSAIGILGYLLIGYGVSRARGPFDLGMFAFVGFTGLVATVFFLVGVKAVWVGIRSFLPGGVPMEVLSPQAAEMRDGRITHQSLGGSGISPVTVLSCFVIFSSFFGLASIGILSASPGDWPFAVLSAAMAIVLIAGGGYLYLQGRKFGKSVCDLRTRPAYIGGTLEAEVTMKIPKTKAAGSALPQEPVTAELWMLGPKGGVLWKTASTIPAQLLKSPGDGTLRIPVQIAIPLETRKLLPSTYHWTLRVEALYPGIDYCADFTVPVSLPKSVR